MRIRAVVQITTPDGVVHEPGDVFDVDADDKWLVEQNLATVVKPAKAEKETTT